MQNKANDGRTVQYTNESNDTIARGTPIPLGGSYFGIAIDDIPPSSTGVLDVGNGTYDLPKTAGHTISAGSLVVIDSGKAKQATTATISLVAGLPNNIFGVAMADAATAATSARVLK